MGIFASQGLGFYGDLVLIGSTPVECVRRCETGKRSQLADAAEYAYRRSHGRFFWGFRLHAIFAPDGTPSAPELVPPKIDEREVGLVPLDGVHRHGGETLSGDRGTPAERSQQASPRPARHSSDHAASTNPARVPTSCRSANASRASPGPTKTSSPSNATAPAPSQASENESSHVLAASPPPSLPNHQLGPPSRALVNYCA